ncbi:Y+L amino acid transporter 2-like [Dermacentor variabilis]|uniref:Y+L amino acid transporter 2-like n=1 Tax=Dermacentor variabilis TaxID=34621 RepID=UPI003F5B728A
MGLFSAVAVIVGNSIGSIIFIVPSIVYQDAGSGGADLLVWMTGGLASLAHALCIAELGTLLPSAGGPYEYVNAAAKSMGRAGELLVFFYLWSFLLMDPVAVTLNGLTFTRYAFSLVYGTCPPPHAATALVTVCVIELAAVVNVFSLKASMKTQNIFFALKLAVLLGIIITGTVWLSLNGHTTPGNLVAAFAIALFPGAGSRLYMAAARQGPLPSFINLISVKSSLPVVAIALRTCIAIPFALTGSVTFLAKSSMIFYCFNVVVVMVAMLRLRPPENHW